MSYPHKPDTQIFASLTQSLKSIFNSLRKRPGISISVDKDLSADRLFLTCSSTLLESSLICLMLTLPQLPKKL